MNIILNENFKIRSTCSSNEKYHSIEDIKFYIPKSFVLDNDNPFYFQIDNKYRLQLCFLEEDSDYNVCKTQFSDPIFIKSAEYPVSIINNELKSNEINIGLKEISYNIDSDDQAIINIINKEILIDKDDHNIIVKDDNNSSYVSFSMNRFQDGIDLSEKIITIKYVNVNKKSFSSGAKNIEIFDNYIVFSWLITSNVSTETGYVDFLVEVSGDLTAEPPDTYLWQTLPAQIFIHKNLGVDNSEVEIETESIPEWYQDIYEKLDTFSNEIDIIKKSVIWEEI